MGRALLAATVAAVALALAGPASGAFTFATDLARNPKPRLRVDASGNAEIAWTAASGARQTLVVPVSGKVRPGTTISGGDVSKPASVEGVPFARQLRAAGETFYAVQLWATGPAAALELRFARWSGDPTEVELEAEVADSGTVTVVASATFAGKPVVGSTPTPGGQSIAASIVLECSGCPAASSSAWARMLKVKPAQPRGEARARLRDEWLGGKVRAIVPGPNRGGAYAPDGLAVLTLPA